MVRVSGTIEQRGKLETPRPELYQSKPGTEEAMAKYCKECGIDKGLVDSYLVRAEQTVKHLKQGFSPTPGREKLKELLWYGMAQAASMGEEWFSGSFRIVDENGKLFEFMQECGDSEHLIYERISTHMERETEGSQWGLDFEPGELPGKKATLLFARLKGEPQTLYMKLEGHGCPPFWQSGFRTLHNFSLYCLHAIDYLRTRIFPSSGRGYATRQEHIPPSIARVYREVMDLPKQKGILERMYALFTGSHHNVKVAGAEEGLSFGVSKMVEKLKAFPHDDPAYTKAKGLLDTLQVKIDAAKARGYTGQIHGNEVLLPPWT